MKRDRGLTIYVMKTKAKQLHGNRAADLHPFFFSYAKTGFLMMLLNNSYAPVICIPGPLGAAE